MQTIDFEIKGKAYQMPNNWEQLTQSQFISLSRLLGLYASGSSSVGDVRLGYVSNFLGLSDNKIHPDKIEAVSSNLYILLSLVDFIFSIKYADEVWTKLSPETRRQALKTEPCNLPVTPESRYLQTQPYNFIVDACFACQLIPSLTVGDKEYQGYTINTDCGELSCSLTARQYIDASERLFSLSEHPEKLALLAAILYAPQPYNSDWAHSHAVDFAKLSTEILNAVALNFQAFVIFLFQKTDYNILRQKEDKQPKGIFVGMSEGLYNLSTDGYGDLDTVSRFSVIEYLSILRSKLIETVKAMHHNEMKLHEISEKTGLDINTINKILL